MLSSFFLNPWMLIGLSAVVIPPIIHLLNRRRYEVVDWGAMQFLQVSEVTRRRLFLEELLLMLLRMGLIAVLVLALAGPFLTSSMIAQLGPRTNRDVVLVFDGSYSMGSTGKEGVPHDKAKEWAKAFVADLTPGDMVAVLQAKEQVVPVLAEPSHDLERVKESIGQLPPPSGGCDWRPALQAAAAILTRSQRAEREILCLSDGQRFGWADRDSQFRWSLLASELGIDQAESPAGTIRPRFWVVNVAPERSADPPNWSLAVLESNRPIVPVQCAVTFRTAMDLHGQKAYTQPHRVRLEIDGQFARDLAVPKEAQIQNGKVPFTFTHRFATPGSHLVSVILEPDAPPEERPAKYTVKDEVPGDNRQDFAIEVVQALPVLLVDGDPAPMRRGSDFLRDALAPALDRTPAVQVRVVPLGEFDPALLAAPEGGKGNEGQVRPARADPAQRRSVDGVAAGGCRTIPRRRRRFARDARRPRRGGFLQRPVLPRRQGLAAGAPGWDGRRREQAGERRASNAGRQRSSGPAAVCGEIERRPGYGPLSSAGQGTLSALVEAEHAGPQRRRRAGRLAALRHRGVSLPRRVDRSQPRGACAFVFGAAR